MSKFILSALIASALALSSSGSAIADVKGRSAEICGGDTAVLVRGYNASTADWFYTTNTMYMDQVVELGWYTSEGNAAQVFTTQVEYTLPLYQSWNTKIGDHLYTTDANERDAFSSQGYDYNSIAAYIFPFPIEECGTTTVPFYRMYNPGLTSHFYTIDESEKENAINNLGYVYEEITGYVFKP